MTEAERARAIRAHERYLERLGREHHEERARLAEYRRRREAGETKPEWLELCILIGFAYLWLSMFMEWWG